MTYAPKTPRQQQLEQATGLAIERIVEAGDLEALLQRGLADLYRNVFAEPPYRESFSRADAEEFFRDYLSLKGQMFVAVDPLAGGKPVAFLISVPLATQFNVAAQMPADIPVQNTAYFADVGIDPDYRRRGLSTQLKELIFDAYRAEGFTREVTRTSDESYKQISAFNKLGGRILSGVFQDVASPRLDGTVTTDRRVYYSFDMAQQAQDRAAVRSFDDVTILRDPAAGDYAVIASDQVPANASELAAAAVRRAYPRLTDVRFVPKQDKALLRGEKVFDGRLYVAPAFGR